MVVVACSDRRWCWCWWFVDPFIGDWDGLDYTMLSVAGYPSSMALGRNLFIFENYLLYKLAHGLFNVQPDKAYLIFKYAVVAQAPLAIIACWALAREVSGSIHCGHSGLAVRGVLAGVCALRRTSDDGRSVCTPARHRPADPLSRTETRSCVDGDGGRGPAWSGFELARDDWILSCRG